MQVKTRPAAAVKISGSASCEIIDVSIYLFVSGARIVCMYPIVHHFLGGLLSFLSLVGIDFFVYRRH